MKETFIQRLRSLIENSGQPINVVANDIGMPTTTLSTMLNRESNLGQASHILEIARYFNVSPYWLVLGEGKPHEKQSNVDFNLSKYNNLTPDAKKLVSDFVDLLAKGEYL